MTKTILQYTAILFSFSLVACGLDGGGGGGSGARLPFVRFSCTSVRCIGVTGHHDTTIVITRTGCANNQQAAGLVASSAVSATCTAGACTGQTGSWLDRNGNPVANVPSGLYNVCGSIDVDDDALDVNDAFAALINASVSGSSSLYMSDWNGSFF